MNRLNVLCLLLAVAGISFGVGQTVGQDRAEAGAQAARVQPVKDTTARRYLQFIFRQNLLLINDVRDVEEQTHATCLVTRELSLPNPYGSVPSCPITP